MFRIEELEKQFQCCYPVTVSAKTKEYRMKNIRSLQALIGNANATQELAYTAKEERLLVNTTLAGEKIFIQYPGKESIQAGTNRRQYDFRPRIMLADGTLLPDMAFQDMWGVVEELNKQRHQMLKLLSCIFFRLGRMSLHQQVQKDCICEQIDANDIVLSTYTRQLLWYELTLTDEIIESLNFNSPLLDVFGYNISLEAFLRFFDLILNNEDSKYFDKKGDLSSGRIPTSDSMLLLASSLYGMTSTSTLLQRFISGNGVARCNTSEIGPATGGLVKLVDRKKDIEQFLTDKGTQFSNNNITVNKVNYNISVKTTSPKISVVKEKDITAKEALESKGWTVFFLEDLVDDSSFEAFCNEY